MVRISPPPLFTSGRVQQMEKELIELRQKVKEGAIVQQSPANPRRTGGTSVVNQKSSVSGPCPGVASGT